MHVVIRENNVNYVKKRVGGTTKSVFLCTGVGGGGRSNSVCTLLKK